MSRYQLLPPLTDEEYAALEADIVANGVLQPILVDEHNVTIDGHHRKQIAEKHGIRCPSIKCPPNLTDEQKRSLSIGMNVHRRHLSRDQRRELIAKSLIADPQLSDRQHAERVGASPTTVGDVRGQLEADGMVSKLDTRTGKDGVAQPAVKVTVRESKSTTTEGVNPVTGEIVGAGVEEAITRPLDYDRDAEQEWEDEVHPPRDEDAIAAAVSEFPFLADYPRDDVLPTAEALRAIPEGPQRDRRIEAAKTWPAAVAAADDIAAVGEEPLDAQLLRELLDAALDAAAALRGFPYPFHESAQSFDGDELHEYQQGLSAAAQTLTEIVHAIRPNLRRVK